MNEPIVKNLSSGNNGDTSSFLPIKKSPSQTRKSWTDVKRIVEFSRKLMYSLNGDSPTNVSFYRNRVYFLGSTRKRDITIKYIDITENTLTGDKLIGQPLFEENFFGYENRQLTKEEQLLRERKRCSFNGITSFCLDPSIGRLVYSENSDLFYFDDNGSGTSEQQISAKGAIDVKICPTNVDLVSYVVGDNLYVQNLAYPNDKRKIQLTFSEDPHKSGVPSYAVQEEFNRYTGYWWQPTKEVNEIEKTCTYRIVYEEVNDENVDLIYISPSCESEFGVDTYRYPKAGTTNSKTELKMIELTISNDSNKTPIITRKKMQKSFYQLYSWYEYLARGEWTPNGKYFWALIYDRLQLQVQSILIPIEFFISSEDTDPNSEMQTSSCFNDCKHVILLNEQISTSWINFHDTMYFLNNSDDERNFSFITALDDTGYLHLYQFKVSIAQQDLEHVTDGVLKSKLIEKKQLTDGEWCVEYNDNVNVDESNNLVYFTAYKDPLESHFFVVSYNEPNKIRQLTNNGYSHKIFMNKKCNYFISICSNLSTQHKTILYELSNQKSGIDGIVLKQTARIICREEIQHQVILDDVVRHKNNELKSNHVTINSLLNLNLDSFVSNPTTDEFVQHLFKPPQIFTFFTDDNCKLYGMIYMPLNYEHGNTYPTILYVYGGPKVQLVSNSYKANKYSRFNILAMLGYCVAIIDSRGSDYRGKTFETYLYKKMGTVEINDQVKGLESASRIFNCIDMKRVAIFGWSYGGYMSLMGLAQRPDIFKIAISGAPVTSWNLYDTAYTERYMCMPDENRESYDNGSVLSWAKSFPDEENRLLIIHGMIDENVHFVHTRKLIDALIKENKPYQLQIYPNERHGIRSPEASLHCDVNFYSFLEQHL